MNILILGANGMVGKAIYRLLNSYTRYHLLTPTRQELDLQDKQAVDYYFKYKSPIDAVIVTAGKVGGILANSNNPIDFFNDNMAIASNCINTAVKYGVKNLIYLGSSCIYPREAEQPIKESALLTSSLEKTNEAYALAKICGVKLCEYYRQANKLQYTALMPCNLYGPGDNYHKLNSHVIPALIRKFYDAVQCNLDEVILWGSGNPMREFMHVDDLARACVSILNTHTEHYIYNVGYGSDITIKNLAEMIGEILGYKGIIKFDTNKPDGTVRKLMDSSRVRALGWSPTITLKNGLEKTCASYVEELNSGVLRN